MKILRPAETAAKVGMCDRQLRDLEAEGHFPKRFPINPNGKGRAVGHLESEVDEWIEQAIVNAHAPEDLAERAALETFFDGSIQAARFAGDFADSLLQPGQVAIIDAGVAEADAAAAAFTQSLQ